MNCLCWRRMVFWIAFDATLATWRSTTLVNSSSTTIPECSTIARAHVTRNCSPFDSTWNGRSHAGGELNPTLDSVSITSRIGMSAGKESTTGLSFGQANSDTIELPNSSRAIVLFPEPDGPTMSPTFQARSSIGRFASHSSRRCSAGFRSNTADICRIRGDVTNWDSRVT